MTTPYPPMTAPVGNTAVAIRGIAEAAPPPVALPAGSVKVALFTTTLVVPAPTPGPGWSQVFTGFSRVDGWMAAIRSSSLVTSDGGFNNRGVYPYPIQATKNPLPLTSPAAMTIPYAMSCGASMNVPAATYIIDFMVWGVA